MLGLLAASGTLAMAERVWADDGSQHGGSGQSGGYGGGTGDNHGSSSGGHHHSDGGTSGDTKVSQSGDTKDAQSIGTDDNHQDDDGVTAGAVGDLNEMNESPEREQEEARQAVASGKAAPLTRLLQKLKSDYPGQILDVALHRQIDRLIFSVKYIDRTGLVKTVVLDALTLKDE